MIRQIRTRVYGIAVRAKLLPYRPFGALPPAGVDELWQSGYYDYFDELGELPRYSILLGYLRHLGERPTILDVGCGTGRLRDRIDGIDFTRYVGTDLSRAAIERARSLEDERTEFVLADRVSRDLGTFTIVVCNEMLYTVPDAGALLADIDAVLEPGGHLLASNYRHRGDVGLHRMITDRFDLIDAVEVRNAGSDDARQGWRITCHRRR